MIDKPENSGGKTKIEDTVDNDQEAAIGGENVESHEKVQFVSQPHQETHTHPPLTKEWPYTPPPHRELRSLTFASFSNTTPNHCTPQLTERVDSFDYRFDDVTKRICVDVADFHGKIDPQAFQDWVTSLDDYFE